MILENTGFNVEHWARFPEDEFISRCLKDGVFKQFALDDREALLKQAYKMIQHDATRNAEKVKPV